MTDIEKEVFKLFLLLNPQPGVSFSDWTTGKGTNKKYKLFSWLIGEEEDRFVSYLKFSRELRKVNSSFTLQIYYDIVVLGLLNIEDRPRCPICGKYTEFDSFRRGYKMTCSTFCRKIVKQNIMEKNHQMLKGRPVSNETREKLSISHKGKIPKEAIKARTAQLKEFAKTEEGKSFYKKLGEENSKRNIKKLISSPENNSNIYGGNKKFKRGKYFSNIFNINFWYDSSWELCFIKYIEKIYKKGDIVNFSRCKDYIEYVSPIDNKIHRYLPDFYIEFSSGIKLVIELKPERLFKSDQLVLSKKIAAKKYFYKKDINYIVLTEKELFISKKEKYYSKKINKKGVLKASFNIYDYIV